MVRCKGVDGMVDEKFKEMHENKNETHETERNFISHIDNLMRPRQEECSPYTPSFGILPRMERQSIYLKPEEAAKLKDAVASGKPIPPISKEFDYNLVEMQAECDASAAQYWSIIGPTTQFMASIAIGLMKKREADLDEALGQKMRDKTFADANQFRIYKDSHEDDRVRYSGKV
jgi:hypothetical protein